MMGLTKYGKVCFVQIAPLTIEGTIISSLDEFAAFKTAFATVSALSDVGENFGMDSKDECSKKFVLTIMGLTTVT